MFSRATLCRRSKVTQIRKRRYIAPLSSFTEDEVMLRDTVSRFAQEVVLPKVQEMDQKSELDQSIIQQCFENGLMAIETEEQFGGSAMSFTGAMLAIEELAKVDASVSCFVDVQNTIVSIPIRKWGNAEQHAKYLPQLAEDVVGCYCLSESSSGSDAFALKMTAVEKGDHFVLNGTKQWITNSGEAGIFVIFANANPSAGYKGITAFIVSKDNPGLSLGKREDKLGIRASSTCEVVLTDCVVPKSDILGQVGQGYKISIEALNEGRIGIAAQMIGIAKGALAYTVPYVQERKQFGQPIGNFQGVQFDIADMATEIEAASLLVYNAARLQEAGKPFIKEAAMAKLYSSLVAEKVASRCINLLGGVGFTKDYPLEKFYRDAKIGQIYEGTNNMQLMTIAKSVYDGFKA